MWMPETRGKSLETIELSFAHTGLFTLSPLTNA